MSYNKDFFAATEENSSPPNHIMKEKGKKMGNRKYEELVVDLSSKKKLRVYPEEGKILIDLRDFYSKDGFEVTTPKGITLSEVNWKFLCENLDEINESLKNEAAKNKIKLDFLD